MISWDALESECSTSHLAFSGCLSKCRVWMIVDEVYSGAEEWVILPVFSLWVSCRDSSSKRRTRSTCQYQRMIPRSASCISARKKKLTAYFFKSAVWYSKETPQLKCKGTCKFYDAFHVDNKNPLSVIGFSRGWLCALVTLQERWLAHSAVSFWYNTLQIYCNAFK